MKKPSNNLIYALIDIRTEEVRYVGRSCSGLHRPKSHLYNCNLNDNSYKTRWIKKNLPHITIKILEEVEDKRLLDEKEIYWISQFSNLTNSQKGGNTGPSIYKYDKKIYQISSDCKTIIEYDSIEKINNQVYNLASIRRCLSGTRTKYKNHYWTTNKDSFDFSKPCKNKPFIGLNAEGEIVHKFNNLMEVKNLGLNSGNIHQCLNNKRKSAHSCTWRYYI